MNYTIETPTNLRDAKKFIEECVAYLGIGFHPDTDFNDYQLGNGRGAAYSAESEQQANEAIAACIDIFDEYNEDIYEYTLQQF